MLDMGREYLNSGILLPDRTLRSGSIMRQPLVEQSKAVSTSNTSQTHTVPTFVSS